MSVKALAHLQLGRFERTQLSISKKNTGRESPPLAPLVVAIVEFQRSAKGKPIEVRVVSGTGIENCRVQNRLNARCMEKKRETVVYQGKPGGSQMDWTIGGQSRDLTLAPAAEKRDSRVTFFNRSVLNLELLDNRTPRFQAVI